MNSTGADTGPRLRGALLALLLDVDLAGRAPAFFYYGPPAGGPPFLQVFPRSATPSGLFMRQ